MGRICLRSESVSGPNLAFGPNSRITLIIPSNIIFGTSLILVLGIPNKDRRKLRRNSRKFFPGSSLSELISLQILRAQSCLVAFLYDTTVFRGSSNLILCVLDVIPLNMICVGLLTTN